MNTTFRCGWALKYFSIGAIGKKLPESFSVDLAIPGKIGLCCKVRPMKQVGSAASITSCTAFQNESTLIAACRCNSGFSNLGSTIDCSLALTLDGRLIHPSPLRLNAQLRIAPTKQIDWIDILERKSERRKNTT